MRVRMSAPDPQGSTRPMELNTPLSLQFRAEGRECSLELSGHRLTVVMMDGDERWLYGFTWDELLMTIQELARREGRNGD